ncbi:hypothetical protein MJO29_001706 [Puccinia striiformis f. sp. tritici]|nr:hypothetical protein MJO29_001706 [Puccinia striiformis f. sp. tritici]
MRVVPALVYLLAGFLADGHPTASAEPNLYQLCDHRVFPEIKPDAASAIPKMEEADSQHHEVLEQHFHTKVLIKDREVYINNPFPGECFSTVHLFSDPLTPLIRSHVHRGWNVLHGQDLEPNYLVARLEHPVESATQITVTYSTGQNVYEDLVQGLQRQVTKFSFFFLHGHNSFECRGKHKGPVTMTNATTLPQRKGQHG